MVVNNCVWDNPSPAMGDALGLTLYFGTRGEVQVWHNTLVDNGGGTGEAIQISDLTAEIADVRNNLIVGHATAIVVTAESAITLDHNLFWENTADFSAGVMPGPNDVHGDPRLFDRAGGDFHILPGSAALDAGENLGVAVDFEGQARPQRGGVDIGADECRAISHTEVVDHLLGVLEVTGFDLELIDDNADDTVDTADVVNLVNQGL